MNRKQLVEQLKQNMPNFEGNQEEQELKKALYLYIKLGKIKSFDEKYYFGNSKTRQKIYYVAQKEKKRPDEIAKKRKIVCVTLTHLYCNILEEFGIKAIPSEPIESEHIYPIIITKNKNRYMADLQSDLENVQTKSELNYFRPLESNSIELEKFRKKLTQYLIEIKYIKNENDNKNEKIEKIHKNVKNLNAHEALKEILENKELYDGNEDMEIIELYKFYKNALKIISPKFFEKKIFMFNCYKQIKDEKEYTLCAFSEQETIKPYLFSKKNRKFLEVDIPTLKKLEEEGLKFGARPKENGARKLQKYIDKQTSMEERDRD